MRKTHQIVRKIAATVVAFSASAVIAAASEPVKSGFAWGADVGGAVDMGSDGMSTVNIDAYCGLKCPYLEVAGIGAGINVPVNNSTRTFPIYGIIRSSMSRTPQKVFGELRAGCVVNDRTSGKSTCDFFCSPAIGFRLAYSATYSSYIALGYIYNGMHGKGYSDSEEIDINGAHLAVVRLGIYF
ncbi:MAG: hypothetical protein HDS15_02125 [Bacteroides sp.]|nr:hypothetical protein [Bacteroides sp.]